MAYKAVLMNSGKGTFATGLGATPDRAVLEAYKKDIKSNADELMVDKLLENSNLDTVRSLFRFIRTDDANCEDPKSLAEEISDDSVIALFDRCGEVMYKPTGYIKYVF